MQSAKRRQTAGCGLRVAGRGAKSDTDVFGGGPLWKAGGRIRKNRSAATFVRLFRQPLLRPRLRDKAPQVVEVIWSISLGRHG